MAITPFRQIKDNATTTLNGAITAATLTIVVADGSVLPTTGNAFIISIDSEDILIDSRSTNTLTVNASGRAYNSTVAAIHASGATVNLNVMAKHVQDLDTAVNTVEAASFPGITVARGGILTRQSAGNGALAPLAIGAANTVLATNGTDPSWRKVVNADIDDAAAIAISKTALGTYTAPTVYSVVWTGGSPSIGNGTLTARYSQIGKQVFYQIHFIAGSTTNFGSGQWLFSLPVANISSTYQTGSARIFDSSGTLTSANVATFDTNNLSILTASGYATSTTPWIWATSDEFDLFICYEAA
jgi:hypothetical protein